MNAAMIGRVSCLKLLAATFTADGTARARIVDRSAVIRFTFIVFFTPRLMVFTEPARFRLTCTTFSTHNLFHRIVESSVLRCSKDRPRESGSLAGACIH